MDDSFRKRRVSGVFLRFNQVFDVVIRDSISRTMTVRQHGAGDNRQTICDECVLAIVALLGYRINREYREPFCGLRGTGQIEDNRKVPILRNMPKTRFPYIRQAGKLTEWQRRQWHVNDRAEKTSSVTGFTSWGKLRTEAAALRIPTFQPAWNSNTMNSSCCSIDY